MSKECANKIILSGGIHDLDKFATSTEIVIKGEVTVNAINLHNNMFLHFILEEGANLVFNVFDYASTLSSSITLDAASRSEFVINVAFIAEVKYDLTIETKLSGDDITGSVNVRGINEKEGTCKVLMNGVVDKMTKGCKLDEYAKVLNKSGYSCVLIPNLIIDTDEVEANHGVSVGRIDDEELFYMMSKGISKSNATKIIEEGFILAFMDEEIKQRIINILVGR